MQRCRQIATQVNPHQPPPTRGEYSKIPARLGRLDDTKAVALSRHGKIVRVIAGELHEYAACRSTLVRLSGGM